MSLLSPPFSHKVYTQFTQANRSGFVSLCRHDHTAPDATAAPVDAEAAAADAAAASAWPPMDAQLVGRRVEALWGDPDAEEAEKQWYSATIVHMRPRARDFTLHFDDGLVEPGIKLPDDSIRLLEEVVPVCSCARCCADDSEGRALPIA